MVADTFETLRQRLSMLLSAAYDMGKRDGEQETIVRLRRAIYRDEPSTQLRERRNRRTQTNEEYVRDAFRRSYGDIVLTSNLIKPGRPAQSIYNTIQAMVDSGELTKVGYGAHVLAQGIAARSGETALAGSTEGKSPVAEGDAP